MLITKSNQSDESVSVLLGVTCNKTVNNLLFLVKTSETLILQNHSVVPLCTFLGPNTAFSALCS